jgi:mxaJ protein
MSSACLKPFCAALLAFSVTSAAAARDLRVCADPNNMPFSNDRLEGFENRIVAILAEELHADVAYTWWAQRRGFIRNTLRAGLCDLVPGTPANMEMLRTTAPYYRSGYVFVTRSDSTLAPTSLDDPVLRTARIGVQIIGDDGANPPPAHALARRGIVGNVRGYTVYGDYAKPNPAARIMQALAEGEIDIAMVWGPLAGFFATRERAPLRIEPVRPEIDGPSLPMRFDISMGVRRGDDAFRQEIEAALARRRADVDTILTDYGVPRMDALAVVQDAK